MLGVSLLHGERTAHRLGDQACRGSWVHCDEHQVDEPDGPGDFRVCRECMHVFRTEAELVAAHNRLLAQLREHERTEQANGAVGGVPSLVWPDVTDASRIWSCPFCVHDF